MADNFARGVGEQLGNLGKQIVNEVVSVPAKIAGLDETLTTGGSKTQASLPNANNRAKSAENADLNKMTRKDEIDTQQQLVKARELLREINQSPQPEQSVYDKNQMEILQKKQAQIQEKQVADWKEIKSTGSKPKPGNLFGKQTGSETKKNVVAQ